HLSRPDPRRAVDLGRLAAVVGSSAMATEVDARGAPAPGQTRRRRTGRTEPRLPSERPTHDNKRGYRMLIRRFAIASAALVVALPLVLTRVAAAQDWKADAPGQAHRSDVAPLPPPGQSAADFPRIVPKPGDANLRLPPGFKIDVFTKDAQGPRTMRVAPTGHIFVPETKAGRIKILHPSADGSSVASTATYAEGLTGPFG